MMIAAAAKTWRSFYSKGALLPSVNQKGYAVLSTYEFPIQDLFWGQHTAGWLETALALTGVADGSVTMSKTSGTEGHDFDFTIRWG